MRQQGTVTTFDNNTPCYGLYLYQIHSSVLRSTHTLVFASFIWFGSWGLIFSNCEPWQPASYPSMRIFAMIIGVGEADWCCWVSFQGYPFTWKVAGPRGNVVEMRWQCVEGRSNEPSFSDLQLLLCFAFARVNWKEWDRPLFVRKAKLTMTLRSGRNIPLFSLSLAVTLGWADSLLSTTAHTASSWLDSTWMRSDWNNESLPCDRRNKIPSGPDLGPKECMSACLRHREGILANSHHILRWRVPIVYRVTCNTEKGRTISNCADWNERIGSWIIWEAGGAMQRTFGDCRFQRLPGSNIIASKNNKQSNNCLDSYQMTECWSKATRRRANKRFVDDAERRFAIERRLGNPIFEILLNQHNRFAFALLLRRPVVFKVVYVAFGARSSVHLRKCLSHTSCGVTDSLVWRLDDAGTIQRNNSPQPEALVKYGRVKSFRTCWYLAPETSYLIHISRSV